MNAEKRVRPAGTLVVIRAWPGMRVVRYTQYSQPPRGPRRSSHALNPAVGTA